MNKKPVDFLFFQNNVVLNYFCVLKNEINLCLFPSRFPDQVLNYSNNYYFLYLVGEV